jgi:AraC-like DNA-binding protein
MLDSAQVLIGRAASSSIRLSRTSDHIARDKKDTVMLLVSDGQGPLGGSQCGRTVELRRGDALIVPSSQPNRTYAMNGGRALSIVLPTAAIGAAVGDSERVAGTIISGASAPLRLIVDYARLLLAKPPASGPVADAVSDHLASLLRLALADGAHDDGRSRVADVRVQLLLNAIVERCSEADLDPDRLGAPLQLSGRSVQHLLQRHGTNFSSELRRARLTHAEEMLRISPHEPITEIALAAGFTDLSTFYRAFRAHFGLRPNEVRDRARGSVR